MCQVLNNAKEIMAQNMEKRTSVIMVSYHTGPILDEAIRAVLNQQGLEEIIVVDNGNPDEVRGKLRAWSDKEEKMKYLTGHGNVGFAKGCNIGAKSANGEYILFLNPDCIIPENAIKNVVEELENNKEAWLAGCCLFGPEGKREAINKRNLLSPKVAMSEVLQLWRIDENKFPRINIKEEEHEEKTSFVPAISGAFMLIKRSRYLDMGGMDEGYFFHVEDLDFCKEIKVQGGKILYVPSVKAVHFRSSSDVTNFFIEYYKTLGFQRYFSKHYYNTFSGFFLPVIIALIWTRFIIRMPKIILRETKKYLVNINVKAVSPNTNQNDNKVV